MEHKNIVATIYLKDTKAVASLTDHTVTHEDVIELAKLYNDSGIDKIIIFDLSSDDDEHERNINILWKSHRFHFPAHRRSRYALPCKRYCRHSRCKSLYSRCAHAQVHRE